MVETASTMMALGTGMPSFSLTDARSGEVVDSDDVAGDRATLVMFLCNHCPYVQHVKEEIARLARDYGDRGVGIVGIVSHDAENYPQDAPDKMKEAGEAWGWDFPYLFDETQEVAKEYGAACTPDFFLFDDDGELAYRGQLDGARPGNPEPVTGEDLRAALDTVLAGEAVPEDQKPSSGCNIKWKPGNEPDYFG